MNRIEELEKRVEALEETDERNDLIIDMLIDVNRWANETVGQGIPAVESYLKDVRTDRANRSKKNGVGL